MSILESGKPTKRVDLQRQHDEVITLSDEEKAAIRKKAKLQVLNEVKDREEKSLLAQFIEEEREKLLPECEMVPVWLDLPGSSECIMLDGRQYFHNRLYKVTPAVFTVLVEQMNRGWAHEEETEVRDAKTRRRHRAPAHVGIGNFVDNRRPRDLVVSSGQLQGAGASQLLGIGA